MEKLKIILACIFAVSLCFAAVSCASETVEDELRKEYPCLVTIDYNGGAEGLLTEKKVFVKNNSLFLEPGQSTKYQAPTKSGFNIEGYYLGEKDSEGNIEFGEKWNFDTDRVTADVILYVKWVEKLTINIIYGENNSQKNVITLIIKDKDPSWSVFSSFTAPTWSGYTFCAFYYDAEYTKKIEFPYDYQVKPVQNIYARFAEGDWTVIDDASQTKSITYSAKIYLLNDIDFDGMSGYSFPTAFNGEINGNGHKIKNIALAKSTTKNVNYCGLFNKLEAKAYIRDVSFENIRITVTFNEPNADGKDNFMGVLAGSITEGAKIENVQVSGALIYDSSKSKRPVTTNILYGYYTGTGNFADIYNTVEYANLIVSDK